MNLKQPLLVALCALSVFTCSPKPAVRTTEIVGTEHQVLRDSQKISIWEKSTSASSHEKVAVFLHGATWSGRPDFDLQIREYSVMEAFAKQGFDTFSVDIQGYGKSDDPVGENWSRTADAVLDLHAVLEWLASEREVDRVDLIGWSWGAQIAGLYANQHPQKVNRLVLLGFTWGEGGEKYPAPTSKFRTNTAEGAGSDFVEGCFEADVRELYIEQCLAIDPVSPNGTLVDFAQHLPLVDPTELPFPVMLIYGEHEMSEGRFADASAFVQRLSHPDRSLIVMGGGGHAILLEKPHLKWQRAVLSFLED